MASIASGDASARLEYLDKAAQLSAANSPSVSAHLGAQYKHLAAEQHIHVPKSRRARNCGACGSLSIPGWSCKITKSAPIQQRSKRAIRSKRPVAHKDTTATSTYMIYTCTFCDSESKFDMPKRAKRPAPSQSPKETITVAQPDLTPDASAQVPVPVATLSAGTKEPATKEDASSASSTAHAKKRARARKQGGLQALLAKSKEKETAAFDSMDFMKSV